MAKRNTLKKEYYKKTSLHWKRHLEEMTVPTIEYVNWLEDNLVKKLNIDDVSNCPLCESTNLHQYNLHHIHCKDCKEQFDKSCC